MKSTRISLLLTLCLAASAWAQPTNTQVLSNQQADLNWFMGSSPYWMVMNRGSQVPNVMRGKHVLGTGGSSVVTDPVTGALIFYTDGSTIYDADHTACPTCTGLSGNPTYDQPSAVCALLNPSQYLVFTNNSIAGKMEVSAVQPGAPLSVVWKNQEVGASAGTGLITVPAPNGTDYYVIYQGTANTNTLQLVDVNPATSTTTFTPRTVTITGAPAFTAKNFAYNATLKRLVITPVSGPVILATVDAGLTFLKTVTGITGEVSDSEFSLNGKYLYISIKGTGNNDGGLLRCDIDAATSPTSVLGAAIINASYDLQFSPDGKIYQIYQVFGSDNYLLGRITDVESPSAASVKYDQKFNNKATVTIASLGGTRLPSFLSASNLSVSVDFDYTGTCTKTPITFFPKTEPTADSVQWSFLGNALSQPWSPVHKFETAGVEVTMSAFYDGQPVTVRKSIALNTFSATLKLPTDTTACGCELNYPRTKVRGQAIAPCSTRFELKVRAKGAQGLSYLWSTGVEGDKTPVDSVGHYYVVATDANGCSAYRGTTVKEYGQTFSHTNYWYFGNKAWVDFNNRARRTLPTNPTDPTKDWHNNTDAPQGCNLAADYMGHPIFYTDGLTVWDKKGNIIDSGIGGSEGTQVEVVQVPGDSTLFYIFTPKTIDGAPGQYEMRYSLFDLKKGRNINGKSEMGGIAKKDQLLFSPSTERVFYNKGSGWLVAHEYGNNIFRAYRITSDGLGVPRTSAIGTVHDKSITTLRQGQIKVAEVDSTLAVAVSRQATTGLNFNRVDFFRFNKSTGAISDYIPLECGSGGQLYGVAISGTKLFAGVRNGTDGINEFLIKDPVTGKPPTSNYLLQTISTGGNDVGAMNYGPDGALYVSVNNGTALGQISITEATKDSDNNIEPGVSSFTANAVSLPPNTSARWGLPTWRTSNSGQTGFLTAAINPTPVCLGQAVNLNTNPSDQNMDTYSWNLDDGQGPNKFPNHKLSVSYTYPVDPSGYYPKIYHPVVTLTNRCIKQQSCTSTFPTLPAGYECNNRSGEKNDSLRLKLKVTVNDLLKELGIVHPVTICLTPSVTLDANMNNRNGEDAQLSFKWTPQNQRDPDKATPIVTTRTYQSSQATIVNVFVENKQSHCRTQQFDIAVLDDRPELWPIKKETICQNSKHDDFDVDPLVSNVNTVFEWVINGQLVGDKHNQPVSTDYAGEFIYEITATRNDPAPSKRCFTKEVATVTVMPQPNITTSIINPQDCNGNDGEIRIRFNHTGPPSGPFAYSISSANWPVPQEKQHIASGSTEIVDGIIPGTYTILVTNETTKMCPKTTTIGVSGPDVFDWDSSLVGPNCSPVTIKIDTKPNKLGNPVVVTRYKITSSTGQVLEDQPLRPLGNSFTPVYKFPEGTFIIEVRNISDCLIVKDVEIHPKPTPTVAISRQCLILNASGATAYEWTADVPGSITGAATGPSINMTPSAGKVTYTVKGSIGECSNTGKITLDVPAALQPSVSASSSCSSSSTFTAAPAGNYVYSWKKDGTPVPSQTSGQITLNIAEDGTKWTVEVTDNANVCSVESSPIEAKIAGFVDAALTSTKACEGQKFTLTSKTTATQVTYSWFHNGVIIRDAVDAEHITGEDGNYKVVVSKRGCDVPAEIQVNKLLNPVSNLSNRLIICTDPENHDPLTSQAVLNPGNFVSYEWKKDGKIISRDQVVTTQEAGKYQVAYTGDNGCTAITKVDVTIDCLPLVSAPNAFKPNSTELQNRDFFLHTFYVTDEFQIIIYNRWGEIVFASDDRRFKWNGGFKNDIDYPVPSGVYAYIVRYKGKYRPEAGTQEMRGDITVLR